jgi:hypothetical protein
MQRRLAALAVTLLIAVCVSAQAKPTVDQCHADFNAWKTTVTLDKDSLGARELQRRFGEMTACADAEGTTWEQQERYLNIATAYGDATSARYLKFLMRHNLVQQFLDEDTEGLR